MNPSSGAVPSEYPVESVLVKSGVGPDVETTEVYYCLKCDLFLGIVSVSGYVAVCGCGMMSEVIVVPLC